MFGAVVLLPAQVAADVTLTDWRGRSASFTEGAVDSSGVKVVYHVAGDGPLVIFVHSITGPWFDYRHQMVALSERYRVVSMSTRGTDKSDKPVGVEHYTSAKTAGTSTPSSIISGKTRRSSSGRTAVGFTRGTLR